MDKTPKLKEYRFAKFNNGVAPSPYTGYAQMVNLDGIISPGIATPTPKLQNSITSLTTGTFTVNTSTDTLTGPTFSTSSLGFFGIRAVQFTTSGGLPSPLATSTTYFLSNFTSGGASYQVATTLANALANTFIDITTAGTGTQTVTSIDPALFMQFARDNSGSGTTYAQDSGGRVWRFDTNTWSLISGNTLTSASGNGICIWKNYLFAFRDSAIDVYNIASPTWNNGWQSVAGGTGILHTPLVGQDDIVYFSEYNTTSGVSNLGSIKQPAGQVFAPGTGATYLFQSVGGLGAALTLPNTQKVLCMAELGVNLMIGTNTNNIYPWDRSSATFALPIICAETNITALSNINNQLYIGAGYKGNLFIYNGYLSVAKQIFPRHLTTINTPNTTIGAIISIGRKLLYTIQNVNFSGIYSVDLITGAFQQENTISNGSFGTSNALTLPALYTADGITYFASWRDNDAITVGVDVSSISGIFSYISSGFGIFAITQSVDIGTNSIPGVMQYAEVYFDRPLLNSQACRLSYRGTLADSFTVLATFNGDGTKQVFQAPCASLQGTDMQWKLEFNTDGTHPIYYQSLIIYGNPVNG